MPPREKIMKNADGEEVITAKDLGYIIDVNKKAIEINIEVEKQNEQVIDKLDDVSDRLDEVIKNQIEIRLDQKDLKRLVDENREVTDEIKESSFEIQKNTEDTHSILKNSLEKKIEEIEKNSFRLLVILGGSLIPAIINLVQSFLHK